MSSDTFRHDRRPHRPGTRARLLFSLVVTATMLAIVGCGIPQFVFLAPPVLGEATVLPPTLTFSHSPDNDTDSFLGYEVYYKFYDPNTADGEFATDRTAIRNASAGTILTALSGQGYRRTHAEGSDRKPLIPVTGGERGQGFTIVLEFQQQSPTGGLARWSPVTPRAIRLVRDRNLPSPAGFTAPELTPATYPDLLPRPVPDVGYFLMGLAVVSYGTDFVTGTFGELYSTAIVSDHLLIMGYQ